jgi:2-polyprenyl-3-methyl-5-hydroxy-6-metoxy-1,4-benzoquinol methylase
MSLLLTSDKLPVAVDPARLREVDCYLCGSADRRVRFAEGPIRLVECRACGLVYITPQLAADDLAALYQDTYWQSECAKDYGYMDYVKDQELYVRTFRKRIRNLTAHRRGGKLLDVGCAAGFFLHVAREHGFDYHGVDVASSMVRFARESLGLENIVEGTLEAAAYPDATFDVVTLWDVIEHLADPLAVLRECGRVMKPDGILVVETQNVRSGFARLMGRRWHHFKMLEHLYHFDPATCTSLLDRAGFEVVASTSRWRSSWSDPPAWRGSCRSCWRRSRGSARPRCT